MADTIVVGFDGSDRAGRALDRAIADAKTRAARVVVVVVAEMPFDPLDPGAGYAPLMPDDSAAEELADLTAAGGVPAVLQGTVNQATERTDAAGVEAEVVWRTGEPGRAIVDVARDYDATAIVIGRDHHHLLGSLFGENVAAEVEREARCEVVEVD
jgi:nucleotide-binding universal stress UspA family protein